MAFQKGISGNPKGKEVGLKSRKTLEWEALGESIAGKQSGKFNSFLNMLWDSPERKDNVMAAELFLNALEYFKPKQARTEVKQEGVQTLEVVIKRK
jgi:hypothetical protein